MSAPEGQELVDELTKPIEGTEEPDELIARGVALINRALEIEADPATASSPRPHEAERRRRHAFDLFALATALNNRKTHQRQMGLMAIQEDLRGVVERITGKIDDELEPSHAD